jgi:hypothetical protein
MARGRQKKPRKSPQELVNARQGTILLLQNIKLREEGRGKPVTRVQLTASLLRRLWNRPRLSPEFLEQVSAWLAVAGWCFFNAGTTYAAVRMSSVKNWPRLGTSKISDDLLKVAEGNFPFEDYDYLLSQHITDHDEASDSDSSSGDTSNDNGSSDED